MPDDPFGGTDELQGLRASSAARGTQIRSWLDVVLRGKWLILAALVAVVVPVTIYTMMLPAQYRANSILLVEKDQQSLASVLPTQGASVLMGDDRNLGNEMLVLRQSLPLARRVAERLVALRTVPGTREPITALGGAARPSVDAVAMRLQGGYLQVSPTERGTDGINLTATSTVPGEAALIANLFADEYLKRTKETSRASYTASREFLENQIAQQGQTLQDREGALKNFMTREGAVDLDQESSNIVSQLAALEAERDATQIELQMKRSTVTALRGELGSLEPRLAQRITSGIDGDITLRQARLADVEGRLETIYLRNPALRTADAVPADVEVMRTQAAGLRAEVRRLTSQLLTESLEAGGVDPTKQGGIDRAQSLKRGLIDGTIEANGLNAKYNVLAQRIRAYEGNLSAIPRQAIELAQMQRSRQSTERLYLALEEKLQEARVAEQSELGYAEQIRPAMRPGAPFSPNRQRNIILGILVGLGLGLGLATLKVALDHRLHRPEDLRSRGYTILGTVPDLTELVRHDFGGHERVKLEGHTLDTRLVSLLNPLSPASESYRSLRTNIQYSRPDAPIRTLLVTSANPGEGKSVTTLNLAVAMAQSGLRILLVDADLRKPSIHTKLGMRREPGLVEALFSNEPFRPEAYTTLVEDLYVMPAGAHAPNPAELLGSKAMRALIDTCKEHFDVILLDSPPVLVATDAPLLAAHCDATIVVVASGATKDYALDGLMDTLAGVQANVIGTVLNRFDASSAYAYRYRYSGGRYQKYSPYGYGYGAGDGASREAPIVTARKTEV